MQTDTILFIILAGIIALFIALFQYRYKSKKRASIYNLLTFLRALTIFLILVLLINPKLEQTTFYNEKPNLVVVVDNSESVKYLNQVDKVDQLINTLKTNNTLNNHFNLDFYVFGKNLKKSNSLSYSEKQTNISKVFKQLSEVTSNSISPMLLITDGNQTYGSDYQFIAKQYKQPIFSVILGDTIKYSDLRLEQLNVNRYAYLKNKFPVEIIAVYNGKEAIQTQLKITSGTNVVHSQNINFNSSNNSQVINITLPANHVGVHSYKAELIPLANEKNSINNVKNFAVEVIDQKTNVAIVSDMLHPDLGTLKKAIESNEQRSASILKTEDYLLKSNDFQLVILYQPNNTFKLVYQKVEGLKVNKFVIIGTKTDWSVLNTLQNDYQQEVTHQFENFQSALNQNYATFIVDDLNFNDFPPLQTEFGETKFNSHVNPILFKTINGIQTREPLLATFENNDKREAILNGEGIWRWRAQSFIEENSFNTFDNFIGKVIQFLTTTPSRSRLNLNYESFYNGGDDIQITAHYFNKNYEFDANARLNVVLTNKSNSNAITVPFVLKNNNYQVDLNYLEPGEYDFIVSSLDENISKSGTLKILDFNVEQQFLNADVTKLQQLATNSNGQSYFIDDFSDIANDLVNDNRFVTVQKRSKNVVPLIDWKYLLILIVLSLVFEWFIRKYNGLI
jgi:uncharacterized protein with PQ loop repeat